MRKRIIVVLAGIGVLLTARPAAAQARSGGDWSILGAETVAPGGDVVHGEFGWPDTSFGWTHGMNPNFDLGLKFSFLYGVENRTDESHFGMAFAVPLRWAIARSGKASILLHVDPGLRLYTYDPAPFGFQFPFGLNVEFATRAPVKFGIGADFNATLFVTGGYEPQFFFGPMIGPYVEYHVDRNLAIGIDTRFGAIVDAYSAPGPYRGGGTDTGFGFRMQAMLAYHL